MMDAFSTVTDLLRSVYFAQIDAYWKGRPAYGVELNLADWEEIRGFFPGLNHASTAIFGLWVDTPFDLRHAEFRLLSIYG
jgi:hypothetical protein